MLAAKDIIDHRSYETNDLSTITPTNPTLC